MEHSAWRMGHWRTAFGIRRTGKKEGGKMKILKLAFDESLNPELFAEGLPSACSGPEPIERQARQSETRRRPIRPNFRLRSSSVAATKSRGKHAAFDKLRRVKVGKRPSASFLQRARGRNAGIIKGVG